MLFNSYAFLLAFLPAVVALFHLARRLSPELAKAVLLLGSLVFYGYWNVSYLPLLLGSILANYALSLAIARSRNGWLLAVAVAGNLALLFYFKCLGFFVGLANAVYHRARVAVQHDPTSRTKYAALRQRGHGHARALRSVADRLLAVACAMLESQTTFDPNHPRQLHPA